MTVTSTIVKNGSYVLIEHLGTLQATNPTPTTEASNRHYGGCHLALVDFRQADLSLVRLIDVDNIASCLKKVSPQLTRVAIVRQKGDFSDYFQHAMNLYHIQGVEAALFEEVETAKVWLLSG